MSYTNLPIKNLKSAPLKTAAMIFLTFLLAFCVFTGSIVIMSLQNGIERLEDRLGADIVVIPNSAKRKIDPQFMLLNGTPGYFYMPKQNFDMIKHIDGIDKISSQTFLASLSASCCSVPVQIIGFDPQTDFIIQPWIKKSYGKPLGYGDVVVGSSVNATVGDTIQFYNKQCKIVAKLEATGTGFDTAVYTNAETINMLIDSSIKSGLNPVFQGKAEDIISSVYIKVKKGYDITKVSNDINLRVRKVKAIPAKSMLSGIAGSLSAVSKSIKFLTYAVWFMVFIILIIAFSLPIGSRKKEFAVLRMLGISRRKLAQIIMKESAVISIIGAISGIAAGYIFVIPFSGLIESSLNLPFLIPDFAMIGILSILTFITVLAVGVLASAYSAFRLSRVDTASILRGGN